MKKVYIFSICCIALCYISKAQSIDSTLDTKLYGGILNRNEYKNGSTSAMSANFHIGGLATWQLSNKLSYTGFGAVQLAPKSGGFAVQVHFLEYKPNTKWKIAVGHIPTPTTEQRPHPVSSGGQFETWTQALIPGAAVGVKAHRTLSKNHSLGAGFVMRNNAPEYHGSIELNKLRVAGFYSATIYGGAVTYDAGRIYTIGVYKNGVVGNTTVLKLVQKLNIKSFWDVGYDHQRKSLQRLEFGIMKTFNAKQFSGLFSIAYDERIQSVTGYLFLYIAR